MDPTVLWAWIKTNMKVIGIVVIVMIFVFVIGNTVCSGDIALENSAPIEAGE